MQPYELLITIYYFYFGIDTCPWGLNIIWLFSASSNILKILVQAEGLVPGTHLYETHILLSKHWEPVLTPALLDNVYPTTDPPYVEGLLVF